jgi:hypothetical protein
MVFPTVAPPDLRGPRSEQTWIYIISESFYVILSFSGSVILKKIFRWSHLIFCIFVIISTLNRTWPFIWTIYNFLYPTMLCAKFDWNWPAGSGEEDF